MASYSHLSVVKINMAKLVTHYRESKWCNEREEAAMDMLLPVVTENSGQEYYGVARLPVIESRNSLHSWYAEKEYPVLAD